MAQIIRQEIFNRAFTAADNGAANGISNPEHSGFQFLLNVSAVSGTNPTLDIKWQEADTNSNWDDIPGAYFETITATGFYCLTVRPGIALVNLRAIPRCFANRARFFITIGGTDTPTFTMTGSFIYLP